MAQFMEFFPARMSAARVIAIALVLASWGCGTPAVPEGFHTSQIPGDFLDGVDDSAKGTGNNAFSSGNEDSGVPAPEVTDAGGGDDAEDAAIDAGAEDAGLDSGFDAGEDAGADAAVDAGEDAGEDAGFDAGSGDDDAGVDAGVDAGADGGEDGGQDGGFDAGIQDAGVRCQITGCPAGFVCAATGECVVQDAGVPDGGIDCEKIGCPNGFNCAGAPGAKQCAPNCDTNACPAGQYCRGSVNDRICEPGCPLTGCGPGEICDQGSGNCIPDPVCKKRGEGCTGANFEFGNCCAENPDNPLFCFNRACASFCFAPTDCPAGYACVSGICQPGTAADAGFGCKSTGCPAGMVCGNDGICTFPAPDGGPDGGIKDGGVKDGGVKDGGVKDGGVKDAGLICQDRNETCVATSECCPGGTCTGGKCVFPCRGDFDCQPGQICNTNGTCTTPTDLCSSDAQCPVGKICSGGSCVDPPPPATVVSCKITTPPGAIKQGESQSLNAVALDAQGKVVAGQSFTWSSSNTAAVTVPDATKGTIVGGNTAGTASISALVKNTTVTCPGVAFENFLNPPADVIRVVLRDAATGAAIVGATVAGKSAAGATATATSDAQGVAQLTLTSPADISVFPANHTYMTVMGTSSRDLLVQLEPHLVIADLGGIKGTFDFSNTVPKEVKMGLGGLSFPDDLMEFKFETVLGKNVETNLVIQGIPAFLIPGGIPEMPILVPSGVQLEFLFNLPFQIPLPLPIPLDPKVGVSKTTYTVESKAGRRVAWGIGDRTDPGAFQDFVLTTVTNILGGSGQQIEQGKFLAQILKFLVQLEWHSVVADVTVNKGQVQTQNMKLSQRMKLPTVVSIPELPRYNGVVIDGALLSMGTLVANAGYVPLGITVGFDRESPLERDGFVEPPEGSVLQPGQVSIRIAPLHSGIEGSSFAYLAIAQPVADLSSSLPELQSGVVGFANTVDAEMKFTKGFPPFPVGSKYTKSARKMDIVAVPDVSFYRLRFEAEENGVKRRWLVYAPASMTSFSVPQVSGGVVDLAGAPPTIQAVGLTGSVTLDQIVSFGSKNIADLVKYIDRFSVLGCQVKGGAVFNPGCEVKP